jgi:hypothetical protein
MTKATYRQIEVMRALRNQGRLTIEPDDIERLTKDSASQLIAEAGYTNGEIQRYPEFKTAESFVQKPHQQTNTKQQPPTGYGGFNGSNGFNAARLGQAANLASYGQGNDYILKNTEDFIKRAVEIYRVLAELEEAVKASSETVREVREDARHESIEETRKTIRVCP